jgi:hypothetical protein
LEKSIIYFEGKGVRNTDKTLEAVRKRVKELQKLKESYLYVDWNDKEGKWESPAIYNEEQKSFIYLKKEASGYIVQQVPSATSY